jgi:hypothetical protein
MRQPRYQTTKEKPAAAKEAGELPAHVGAMAGTTQVHDFYDMTWGLGGSQCMYCFGFADDPRHYLPDWWVQVVEATAAYYEDQRWK